MKFVTFTKAIKVEERFRRRYLSGVGKDAVFETQSLGWYLWMRGSSEMMHLGFEQPNIKTGDRLKITIEKVNGNTGNSTTVSSG